jgi:CRISPR-associated protein Cmr6
MSAPLYQLAAIPDKKPDDAHAGLWFDRFFNAYKSDWTLAAEAKSEWIKQLRGPVGRQIKIERFIKRQIALVSQLKGSSQRYITDWHFITGMGNSHPVENGFSWHPTLGVPYLAGSAVKGLVRAWVELNDEALNPVELKARLKSWFGTEEKGGVAEQAGDFIFFDAIPDQRPSLVCDIMTPHMCDWYAKGGEGDPHNTKALPADWHEPVPVSFLAVKHAQLIFSIAPCKAEQIDQLAAVFNALSQALEWLGAGAKTAAGYGYMTEDQGFLKEVQDQHEQGNRA